MAQTAGPERALLLTGTPGIGKTTIVNRLVTLLGDRRIRGFVTDELRHQGKRIGFALRSLDGRTSTLAHIDLTASHRVGRYGVDVSAVEEMVAHTLESDAPADLYLVDEIGSMECYSTRFVRAINDLLDMRCPLVATIAQQGSGFIAQVKGRPEVELWTVTLDTRDTLPEQALAWLARRGI